MPTRSHASQPILIKVDVRGKARINAVGSMHWRKFDVSCPALYEQVSLRASRFYIIRNADHEKVSVKTSGLIVKVVNFHNQTRTGTAGVGAILFAQVRKHYIVFGTDSMGVRAACSLRTKTP